MSANPVLQSGYTPGRTSTVTFDVPDYTMVQEQFWKSLTDLEITGEANTPGSANVIYLSGIGYRLSTKHDAAQFVHEEAATDSLVVGGSPTGFIKQPIKRVIDATSGFLGVPTGSQVQGDNFYRKQVVAGTSWDANAYQNITDYEGYPPPTETEIIPLDRVRLGTTPLDPSDTIITRFYVPSMGGQASIGLIARIYFVGLASYPNGGQQGTGQYALSLNADGQAFLWELAQGNVWALRRQFQWCPRHLVAKNSHFLMITSDAYLGSDAKWHGTVINFTNQSGGTFSMGVVAVVAGLAVNGDTTQYVVPQNGQTQNITFVPARADVRRDLRALFSVSLTKYAAQGTLVSQTFTVPRTLGAVGGNDPPFNVTFNGSIPAETSVSIAMYGADTGTACAPGTGPSGNNPTQVYASFQRQANEQSYYIVATLNASGDGSQSPYLNNLAIVRQGVVATYASVPFVVPPQSLQDYSIVGPGMDPTIETASIGLVSQQDGFTVAGQGVADPLAALNTRSGHSVMIEVNGLPANAKGNTTSTIFLGKNSRINRYRKGVRRWLNPAQDGSSPEVYPSPTWWFGKVLCNGLWKRLWQAKTIQTWNFGVNDPATGSLYTITKIINTLFSNAGLPGQMLDIASNPITLQADPKDKARAYQFEVFSEALAEAIELGRDYLGAALVVDPNATNGGGNTDKFGCVRLKLPPRPASNGSYPALCNFVDGPNWTAGLYANMNLNSYQPVARAWDGAMIPSCPLIQGTIRAGDEPPEGNVVYVVGGLATASGGSLSIGGTGTAPPANLWAILHNWPAAHFFDAQPMPCDNTNPDYTDGSPNLIVIVDPTLNTQGAVNFACRRTFDLSCHRRNYMSFEAPVVMVTDPSDTLQIRQRPLRWGDCVMYNDGYWFVSNVNVDMEAPRGGTRNSSAVYELYQIPQLQEISDGVATVYQSFSLYGPIASQRT
jgi:hypothetical protein